MKKLLFILLICILVGATGCQSTPKAVDRDGINKAIDKIEDEANSYLENSSATEDTNHLTEEVTSTSSNNSGTIAHSSNNTQGQNSSQTQSNQPVSAIQTVLSSTPTTYKKTMSGVRSNNRCKSDRAE